MKRKKYSYHYDLEKIKKFVLANNGMWEMDEPPVGCVFYLYGTIVCMGNDSPYIVFDGDIKIARKLHKIGKVDHPIYTNDEDDGYMSIYPFLEENE